MDRRKGFDLYHTEIVIIRKEVYPTVKFENIDQVTFKLFRIHKKCYFSVKFVVSANIFVQDCRLAGN